jgi:hypothetical protein
MKPGHFILRELGGGTFILHMVSFELNSEATNA